MGKVKMTLRLRPQLAAALREQAARETRSVSEMLRVVLEGEKFLTFRLQAQKIPRPKGRGETVTVFLEAEAAERLKQAARQTENCTLNAYVNAGLERFFAANSVPFETK